MRRYSFVILFLIVLIAPFLLRRLIGTRQIEQPTTNALKLVIITPHGEQIRAEFEEAFTQWHEQHFGKSVDIDFWSLGASDIVRYFDAGRSMYESLGTYKIDLVWGGGDDLFERRLKGGGHLDGVRLDPTLLAEAFPQRELGGLPLYDTGEPPQWFGTALSSFGIAYNRDALRHLGLPEPQTWRDLADDRYFDWIVMADPTRSSVARTSYMIIVERAMADAAAEGRSEDDGWAEGMGLVRLISSNARLFTDASAAVPGQISSGNVAAGMTIDFHSLAQIDAVGSDRMGYVEPKSATVVNPDPIALVKGAENRTTAIRFIEFLLSERGQRLWYRQPGDMHGPRTGRLYRLPVRESLYQSDPELKRQANPFAAAEQFNTSAQRRQTGDIIPILVEMSCMTPLDELRRTRREIVQSRRQHLLDTLGKFPFGQAEALRRQQQWKSATPSRRLELERIWTEEFREEYRQLREEAGMPK